MEGSPVTVADSHGADKNLSVGIYGSVEFYFPMMNKLAWVKVIAQNWRTIFRLTKEAMFVRRPEVHKMVGLSISSETLVGKDGESRFSDLLS